ncbi:autophagy-related protein 10-like [Tropilaelaps mercedesae]|uniref:Ubiquitin-like-conjugating enzyme ATG10 n=1 Tax=Tropilaelaps mercedesae TaxID=418985 RepID=A0A1V9XQR3_9ACAR|nr:autophagy-related protein 10-like [Tropilaelaps mercedesae]
MRLKDMWSTVTRHEHPVLRRPFFLLHPCNTHDLMKPLLRAQGKRRMNYLITWLSSVGPVVGLRLPLGYGKARENLSDIQTVNAEPN